eukprot:scaffold1498_cov129-Isochrysis_galbana.AAC.2
MASQPGTSTMASTASAYRELRVSVSGSFSAASTRSPPSPAATVPPRKVRNAARRSTATRRQNTMLASLHMKTGSHSLPH